LSNILVPLPKSTGTRWMESSSTSPALRNCCPVSAPPITVTPFSPAAALACSRVASIPPVTKV
jgi:hypothetical protein